MVTIATNLIIFELHQNKFSWTKFYIFLFLNILIDCDKYIIKYSSFFLFRNFFNHHNIQCQMSSCLIDVFLMMLFDDVAINEDRLKNCKNGTKQLRCLLVKYHEFPFQTFYLRDTALNPTVNFLLFTIVSNE